MRRIAVIGGGLAGLVVAFRRSAAGDRVTLYEAETRLGGQLHTERTDGFTIEHGAEGFVAGSEAVRVLAGDLGIESDLVGQLVTKNYSFDGRNLLELRAGEAGERLGFQVARRALGKGIGSFRLGMAELSDGLVEKLRGGVDLRPGGRVASITPAERAWRIEHETGGADEADAVVVATTAATAASVLEPAFGEAARELAQVTTNSSITVSLAYARRDVEHSLDGTGFVVAQAAQHEGFRACTFVSSKLPERAPAEKTLLRAFFRPAPGDQELSNDAWSARAERALARAIRLQSGCERSWVSRWPAALPVFDDAHRERVGRLETALAGQNVFLAGSAFHGSGIDAAVRSAEAASRALGAVGA